MSFAWYGDEILARIGEAAADAVRECALDLKEKSLAQVPVDSGALRGNCSVAFEGGIISPAGTGEQIGPPGGRLAARVGYTLPYAIRQHEDLGASHAGGGKAKFLEDPLHENSGRYTQMMADAARKVIV